MKDLPSKDIVFEQGTPFTPLLQLLSVLPPQSAGFLPPSYQQVMTDVDSPVVDYYPKDFEVDANGKKNSWECIVRIPFINEQLLVDTVSTINHRQALTESERMRNVPGEEHSFLPAEPQGMHLLLYLLHPLKNCLILFLYLIYPSYTLTPLPSHLKNLFNPFVPASTSC